MKRVAVIGNSGGGKSVLARGLATRLDLPYVEIDGLLWQSGWRLSPDYAAEHARRIAGDCWVIDGLGSRDSIPARLARATDIVLVDMELWVHFCFAAERQIAWALGELEHPPGGIRERPPLEALFRTIWDVDREWMPEIRRLAEAEANAGKPVYRLTSIDALDGFVDGLGA